MRYWLALYFGPGPGKPALWVATVALIVAVASMLVTCTVLV